MKGYISLALKLLFPPRCAVCDEVTAIGEDICPGCLELLSRRFDGEKLCGRCGKPKGGCICSGGFSFKGCVSAFEYCGETRPLFEALKNDAGSSAASQLAGLMARSFCGSGLSRLAFDGVTSVPASRSSVERKGFDHARLLAERLGERLGIPYAEPPIGRADSSRPQHRLNARERWENAGESYFALPGGSISGRILLADDIMTTGATLDRCAALLLGCGADEVYCLTAATTLLREEAG